MKSIKKRKSNFFIYTLLGLILVMLLLNNLWLIRFISEKQIDDVNYLIDCKADSRYLDKSEVLMVIPIYQNQSIANFVGWCNDIRSLNKTLGMHGVYHTYQEFLIPRNESYVLTGMNEFKKCFGYYPQYFEAPQVAMSLENIKLIASLNMTYRGYSYNLFHEVYHCSDSGKFSNKIMDIF